MGEDIDRLRLKRSLIQDKIAIFGRMSREEKVRKAERFKADADKAERNRNMSEERSKQREEKHRLVLAEKKEKKKMVQVADAQDSHPVSTTDNCVELHEDSNGVSISEIQYATISTTNTDAVGSEDSFGVLNEIKHQNAECNEF